MSHRIIENLPELVALAERETKLRDKQAKYGRAITKWQQEFDQQSAAYEDALMESNENGGPPPDKPEPPPAPEVNSKQTALTNQLMFIRDERKEIVRQHAGALLEALAERETEILHGLKDAVTLLQRGTKELSEVVQSRTEVETAAYPGHPRDDVPTDLLAVTKAVADGQDALPSERPTSSHVTQRVMPPS